jgi:hypothetical protein
MDKCTSEQAAKGARRNAEEGRELARRWRASGLTVSEFCRRNQVPSHVVRYWALDKTGVRDSAKDFFVFTAGAEPGKNAAAELETPRRDEAKAVVIVIPLRAGAGAFGEALAAVLREVGA